MKRQTDAFTLPSPPSKRQRLSSPTYEQQVGDISAEDLDAFDETEARLSQLSNGEPRGRDDPDNPFAPATGFASASKLACVSLHRSSSPELPPEQDYDAWFKPADNVPEVVSFQTARSAAGFALASGFGKASGKGTLQPSSAAMAKAQEKMETWKDKTTVTESQGGAENMFKAASSMQRMGSPERTALRRVENVSNSPGTPSPAESSRSSIPAPKFSSPLSLLAPKGKGFKAPTFVSSPLNPRRPPTSSLANPILATPIRPPLATTSQTPFSSSRNPKTKPAFKTPFKAGMKPGEAGRAALDQPRPTSPALFTTPARQLQPSLWSTPVTPRVTRRFFDLIPCVGRKTLATSGLAPQSYTTTELEEHGIIVSELERITPSLALYYNFHTTTSELIDAPSTPARVFGPAAALEELLALGCSLATKRWVENHWCLILWKLAGMVCLEPELERDPQTKRWCWEEVFRQLLYRYEREINRGVRPPLRQISTQDAPASCPMILCVSNIIWQDAGVTEDGIALPAHPELEVTDGWYRLRAQIDAPMARAVRRGVIRIGRKIGVVGAQLSNQRKDPQEILEAYNSTKLVISGNSAHLVPWHCKLGFRGAPWVATMRSLTADGGTVPALDVVLLKVYPVAYFEFIDCENGDKRREGPRNANEEAAEEEKWKRRREVHESRLREEIGKKEARYRGYAERLERKAGKFAPSEDEEPEDDIDDLYDQLEDAKEAGDVLASVSGSKAGWLARCIIDRLERDREREMEDMERELKALCPPREVRNFRVLFVQDACTVRRASRRTAQLTLWDALRHTQMGEGEQYLVTNMKPTSPSAWMSVDEDGAEIYLSTQKHSKVVKL
ncbi:hypothetical protein MKEN_01278900 [Mycena kentingensis (nom. inval.)]|nr:hypothetical protein MKEN_01278900 [Mycena kentingensis (nom. inval.)]